MKSNNYFLKTKSWIVLNSENLIPICLCILWLFGGALVAYYYINGWNPYESIYFAFSSLATGGQQPIPADSPKRYFLIGIIHSYILIFLSFSYILTFLLLLIQFF